jgi:hypothetical protein
VKAETETEDTSGAETARPGAPSKASPAKPQRDLDGRELVVAVGGGIAAYKVCHVVSRLVQRGCGVTVAMTERTDSSTPLTFHR